jgi:hypothetical protein
MPFSGYNTKPTQFEELCSTLNTILLLLLLWRFGPFSGHGLPDLPEHN